MQLIPFIVYVGISILVVQRVNDFRVPIGRSVVLTFVRNVPKDEEDFLDDDDDEETKRLLASNNASWAHVPEPVSCYLT